ncbi:hypothetical protein BDR26DRAFT_869660 [Obelidium mucronatum]|nr:hypothetical protein BDR26DRAFT_869660 [Obelidium mucronatum]
MTKKQLDPVDLLLKAPNNQIDYLQAEVEDLMNGIPQAVLKKHEESQQSTTASVNGGTSKSRLTARQLLGLDSISPVLSSALPPKPALAIAAPPNKANSYDSMLENIDVNLRDLNVSSENEDFDVDDLLDGYGAEETKTVDPASIPKPVTAAANTSPPQLQQEFPLESAARLTNSEILTRLDSILKQWFREFNPAQFMKSYNGLNNSHYTTILLNNLLNDAMGKGGVAVAHTARLLPHLVTEKYFTLNDIRSR